MLQEYGISVGAALIVLITFYFIIKWGVKNGIKDALEDVSLDEEYQQYIKKILNKNGK